MILRIFLFALFLLLVQLSCKAPMDSAEMGQCELHHIRLQKAVVPGHFGKLARKIDPKTCPYPKTSPDQGSVKPPWPLKRLAVIYWCSRCDSVYRH
jgi:hypothetical protein